MLDGHFVSQVEGQNPFEVTSSQVAVQHAVIKMNSIISEPSHCDHFERGAIYSLVDKLLKPLAHGQVK